MFLFTALNFALEEKKQSPKGRVTSHENKQRKVSPARYAVYSRD
jgi:hypothetical protein